MDEKETKYYEVIQRQLMSLYTHMTDNLLDWLPDEGSIDTDEFTPKQRESVLAVQAIEAEWILDEDQRREVSLIAWEDDDED